LESKFPISATIRLSGYSQATVAKLRSLAPLINYNGVRKEIWRAKSHHYKDRDFGLGTRGRERPQAADKGANCEASRANEVGLQKVTLLQQALQEEQNR